MKFIYKVVDLNTYYQFEKVLNDYGEKGWELVQVLDQPTKLKLIFKKVNIAE